MMRFTAAALLVGTALGLSACSGNGMANVQSAIGPIVGSSSSPSDQTYNLDNSRGTMFVLDYPEPECHASGAGVSGVKCLKALTGATFTLDGNIETVASPGNGQVFLSITREGIDGHLVAICPAGMPGCSSLTTGESIHVVTKLTAQDASVVGTDIPVQMVVSITPQ